MASLSFGARARPGADIRPRRSGRRDVRPEGRGPEGPHRAGAQDKPSSARTIRPGSHRPPPGEAGRARKTRGRTARIRSGTARSARRRPGSFPGRRARRPRRATIGRRDGSMRRPPPRGAESGWGDSPSPPAESPGILVAHAGGRNGRLAGTPAAVRGRFPAARGDRNRACGDVLVGETLRLVHRLEPRVADFRPLGMAEEQQAPRDRAGGRSVSAAPRGARRGRGR